MTIAVLIKQVPDMNAIRIDRATGRIVPSPQLVISSYDQYAIEAALRLRDSLPGEVVVVSAGPASARDAISRALAMGADQGIHLELADVNAVDTLDVARVIADAVRPLETSVILAGQTADDLEAGQVGAQVAELLDMPLISNVVAIEVQTQSQTLLVRRDMEDGYQTVRCPLPALLLSSTGLDEPRLPSLKGIMAAKKKPIDAVPVAADNGNRLAWDEPYVPAKSTAGTLVQDLAPAAAARQLVAWLRERKLI